MKEILLTCPKCFEPVIVPADETPFKKHVCPTKPRSRFFATRLVIIPEENK